MPGKLNGPSRSLTTEMREMVMMICAQPFLTGIWLETETVDVAKKDSNSTRTLVRKEVRTAASND